MGLHIPCESKLARRALLLLGEGLESCREEAAAKSQSRGSRMRTASDGRPTMHKLEVLLEDAFSEAREQAGAAQVTVSLEVRSVLEPTRQGPLAERRVGEDTDSELFARVQDAVILHVKKSQKMRQALGTSRDADSPQSRSRTVRTPSPQSQSWRL